MKLTELKEKKLTELKEIAKQMNIEKSSSMSKENLINAISSNNKNDKQEVKKPVTEENKQNTEKKKVEVVAQPAGFEPTREFPNRCQVDLLNHSDTGACLGR